MTDRDEWMRAFRSARAVAHLIAKGEDVGPELLDPFRDWLRRHMAVYVATCKADGRTWSQACDSDLIDMAGWVAADLDLDDKGLALADPDKVARDMCAGAGWP